MPFTWLHGLKWPPQAQDDSVTKVSSVSIWLLVLRPQVTSGWVKREAGRGLTAGEDSNLRCPRNGKRTGRASCNNSVSP